MKVLFNIFSVVIVLWSCRPEPLDVKLDEYEPKVVVSSQVIPNYLMVVGLTRSFTVLSSAGFNGGAENTTFDNLLIDSALVTISTSYGTDTLFKLSSGLFVSLKELAMPGGTYNLKVVDYGLRETITANSTMLQNVPLDTVIPTLNLEEEEDTSINLMISFVDPKEMENFYVLSVYSRNSNTTLLDINMFFENGSNKLEYQELIKDRNSDSDTIKRAFTLKNVKTSDSLMVSLSNISEGYYSFLKSRERSGSLLSEITNEPINYPTNINGGYGYFNTHNPSFRFFDLKFLLD
ncbi:DUF4249 domain-containing protein [Flavobacteriales bacterium]|nr:DUF4249 domain-containing protein [Flavobacteriales bacterium]